jgi:hypothetical protein
MFEACNPANMYCDPCFPDSTCLLDAGEEDGGEDGGEDGEDDGTYTTVVISEVSSSPVPNVCDGQDYIELFNPTANTQCKCERSDRKEEGRERKEGDERERSARRKDASVREGDECERMGLCAQEKDVVARPPHPASPPSPVYSLTLSRQTSPPMSSTTSWAGGTRTRTTSRPWPN